MERVVQRLSRWRLELDDKHAANIRNWSYTDVAVADIAASDGGCLSKAVAGTVWLAKAA